MKQSKAWELLGALIIPLLTVQASRPRGVAPEFAKYFKSETTFSCILNPSISIKSHQVNDDYCDCPDGSDEPGTAACTVITALSPLRLATSNSLNSTLALPGFYCKNKGHRPANLAHTLVNDGVCDYETCCDGSDEWAGVGGVNCVDRCEEIGNEWRRLDAIKQKSLRNALQKRVLLVNEATALRASTETRINELELEIASKETNTSNLKKKLEDLERRDRSRAIKKSDKVSKAARLAALAKERIEKLRHALLGMVIRRDALTERIHNLESILTSLKEEYNPNFNDDGVKRAVKKWEDYAAAEIADRDEASEAEDKEMDQVLKEDSAEHGIHWEEWEIEEDEIDSISTFLLEWSRTKLYDLRSYLSSKGILPAVNLEASESKAVENARKIFQAAADELSEEQFSLGKEQADLTKDYGIDEVFRALKGRCIESGSGEYRYELCWLGEAKQKSNKGGSQTGIGTFTRFEKMVVDEEMSIDGKGLGKGERLVLKYENGQGCWNGPSRQTTVILGCAENDEIWKVYEAEKCMYRMHVGTPAVCGSIDAKK